ncbi:MAG: hypothetical protein EWM73_00523 [Nitrospira sp.]|nr:MAG: hypothetical protein EWM73_00523 [Nitrospira sp.]
MMLELPTSREDIEKLIAYRCLRTNRYGGDSYL